ncbi:Ti-type conjugative transfer relaxase TraA [Neorhizobium sp. S3-V5DH]|uniref:Ti-type conjugative transfer relaxase TraA n=1 Tax=Neorhizobium sp. S3-V5DH TaxID=2485166 RepID=UPI00105229CF|nr:Ti-type conjugative transfer relaxase TraA [Neorhizobium sp. S3-V5DH]TCV60243.1 plasmid mobilization system relaxase [Neorhizobium sp. S3-V5DH]
MAIYHASTKPISRNAGRSAVAAAAYRAGERLANERDGQVHDFTRKQGVEHSEIVLPTGVGAEWARDRAALWNAAERRETRKDARVAREFEIALPHELTREQRLRLTRAFAQELANRFGAAVDFAIHSPHERGEPSRLGDIRNHHAHLLMTTRQVMEYGLGIKTHLERENKWLLSNNLPTSQMQLRDIRQLWEHHVNRHLAMAGLDIRVDHRSHQERGLEIEPTQHVGVHASQMERRELSVSRTRLDAHAARQNAELFRQKPDQVLSVITSEKSVFDRHDVARTLHRYVDEPEAFQNAFAAVMASPALVELQPEQAGKLARYSTREMVAIEHVMAMSANKMAGIDSHFVERRHVDWALRATDASIKAKTERGETGVEEGDRSLDPVGLSDEQRMAVRHITGPEQIATVIGFAGAGKSTMLAAARQAWERQGYRVHGAALAGKAAEGLEASSGIQSRTLASIEYGWQAGRGELGRSDILVIDEAGMVGSRQLARFISEAETKGTKLVLVGDHEQLQAIGAGSPLRAITERIGAVELSEIRRQKASWQRQASSAFATHRTGEGLKAYNNHGSISFEKDRQTARAALVRDYVNDYEARSSGSRIALAHRRVDVRIINTEIRALLQERGRLAGGKQAQAMPGREVTYQTTVGERSFAAGDRIVLLENNRDLGVRNGMLGTVLSVEPNAVQVRLDGRQDLARTVSIPVNSYQSFDHGYAITIHKSQGTTVDRSFVMGSRTMDRHLAYVAMTRHRDSVRLYAGRDELKDMKVLSASMSRSGVKETTLDYTKAFTERRGLAEELGVRSEIVVGLQPNRVENRPTASTVARMEWRRSSADVPHPASVEARRDRLGAEAQEKTVEPLVPALTKYSRNIETIARENARPTFERAMQTMRDLARSIYADPDGAVTKLREAIVEKGLDEWALPRLITAQPERFGELRGRSGIFGENRERREARSYTKAFSIHVGSAVESWQRRLDAERQSETWLRDKRDVIEVPGLSSRSEEILNQLDALSQAEKPRFLEQLSGTSEGRLALEEAKKIVLTLEQRFGSADLRDLRNDSLRMAPKDLARLDRIKAIAGVAERARNVELSRPQPSRQLELKQDRDRGIEWER